VRYEEGRVHLGRAWGTHKFSLYKRDWAIDDGRALWLAMGILFGDIPNIAPHMLQRAWGQGAVRTTGRVRGGALLSKGAQVAFLPPNDSKAEGIRLGAGARRFLQSPLPSGRGRHCWKSDETGRLSGLLVAVLDRHSLGEELNQLTKQAADVFIAPIPMMGGTERRRSNSAAGQRRTRRVCASEQGRTPPKPLWK